RNPEVYKYLGGALFKLERFEGAVDAYNHAIEMGANDYSVFKSKGRALEELGRTMEAMDSYERAASLESSDAGVWNRLGIVHMRIENHDRAVDCFDQALKLEPRRKDIWLNRAALMEKVRRNEEALKSYDSALGLDSEDKVAWNGKGMVLLQMEKYDQAKRAFDKALQIDPGMDSAEEGRRAAENKLREVEISEYAEKIMELEYRQNKRVTKEEAFRDCGVPYSMLEEVLEFLERREPVNLSSLGPAEFREFEELSRRVLLATYQNPNVSRQGIRLPDVLMALPNRNVPRAKRVLSYIEKVNEMEMSPSVRDLETEKYLRAAMDLPEEQRSVLGMMEGLGVGLYTARKLTAVLSSMQKEGYRGSGVRVKDLPQGTRGEEVPSSGVPSEPRRAPPRPSPPRETPPEVQTEPDLYQRFYGSEESGKKSKKESGKKERKGEAQEEPEEMQDRRCLFHGGLAVQSCPSCGTKLCNDCMAEGRCPRCKAPLGPEEEREEPGESRDLSRL
ncbi:MAG: tetratricopeptide repeat protein, partial [Methanomassiliicoccales archaeon]